MIVSVWCLFLALLTSSKASKHAVQSEIDAEMLRLGPKYDLAGAYRLTGILPSTEAFLVLKCLAKVQRANRRTFAKHCNTRYEIMKAENLERIRKRNDAESFKDAVNETMVRDKIQAPPFEAAKFDKGASKKLRLALESGENLDVYLKMMLVDIRNIPDEDIRAWFLAKSYKASWYDEDYWMRAWFDSIKSINYEQALSANNRAFIDVLHKKFLPHSFLAYKKLFSFKRFRWGYNKIILKYDAHESLRFLIENEYVNLEDVGKKEEEVYKYDSYRCLQVLHEYGLFEATKSRIHEALSGSPKVFEILLNQLDENNIALPRIKSEKLNWVIESGDTGTFKILHERGLIEDIGSYVDAAMMKCSFGILEYIMNITGKEPNRMYGETDMAEAYLYLKKAKDPRYLYEKFGWKPSLNFLKTTKNAYRSAVWLGLCLEYYPEFRPVIPYLNPYQLEGKQEELLTVVALRSPQYFHENYSQYLKFLDINALTKVFGIFGNLQVSPNHAALKGRTDVVQFIFERTKVLPCRKALIHAARLGHIGVLRFVYEKSGGELFPDRSWMAEFSVALSHYSRRGKIPDYVMKLEVVEFMHKTKGQVTKPKELLVACEKGDLSVVRYVYENCRVSPSASALDYAAMNGFTEIVDYVHKKTRMLPSVKALDIAAYNGNLDVIKLVHSINPELMPSVAGIHNACRKFHVQIVEFFFQVRGLIGKKTMPTYEPEGPFFEARTLEINNKKMKIFVDKLINQPLD